MKDRLKQLRKAVGLTQQEFATRIGTVQNSIASYESGRRLPSASALNNICKTFHVNENWLRTGEGEMFEQSQKFDLNEYAQEHGASEFELNLVRTYFSLPVDVRTQMMDALKACVQQSETPETAEEKAARLEKENQALAERYAALEKELAQLEGREKPEAV